MVKGQLQYVILDIGIVNKQCTVKDKIRFHTKSEVSFC